MAVNTSHCGYQPDNAILTRVTALWNWLLCSSRGPSAPFTNSSASRIPTSSSSCFDDYSETSPQRKTLYYARSNDSSIFLCKDPAAVAGTSKSVGASLLSVAHVIAEKASIDRANNTDPWNIVLIN